MSDLSLGLSTLVKSSRFRLSLFGSTDEVATDTIEAMGWLLAELGDFTNVVFTIAMACRTHTFDYAPNVIEVIPNAKP